MKAHRQTVIRQAHNRELRSKLRTGLKAIRAAMDSDQLDQARGMMNDAFSLIDKMASKGIIHDNAAGRHKSRLVKRLRAKSA